MTRRQALLQDLVALARPLDGLLRELHLFPWDVPEPLVTLSAAQTREVLERHLAGELALDAVQDWAEAIECRDDIALEDANEGLLKQLLFELANPDLQDTRPEEAVRVWARQLASLGSALKRPPR